MTAPQDYLDKAAAQLEEAEKTAPKLGLPESLKANLAITKKWLRLAELALDAETVSAENLAKY